MLAGCQTGHAHNPAPLDSDGFAKPSGDGVKTCLQDRGGEEPEPMS